jgi:hypothetical protein
VTEVGEDELLDGYARLRATLGSRDNATIALAMTANPKTVMPVDLETSPNLRRLGRLPLSPADAGLRRSTAAAAITAASG